jgi:hypothetical protein
MAKSPGNFRTMLRCHARPWVVASVAYICRTIGSTSAMNALVAARAAATPFAGSVGKVAWLFRAIPAWAFTNGIETFNLGAVGSSPTGLTTPSY